MNKLIITYVKWSDAIKRPINAIALFTLFCFSLISLRYFHSGNITYFFLAWNIFLAWVPLLFAKIWFNRMCNPTEKPLALWKSVAMFILWLLFFPNAPYLITDLVHLNSRFNPALWSDTLLLFSCALCGLIVGIYSLHIVHKSLKLIMPIFLSWLVLIPTLLLTGFGIYLGRVQRWNSWDLFTQPIKLIQDSVAQLGNPQAISMTLGFSCLLFILYFMLNTIINNERHDR